MIEEPKVLRDGSLNLLGVDSSVASSLIQPDKVAFAGNVIFRGGFAMSRPGFTQIGFVYPTEEIAEWVEEHILQGSIIYKNKRSQSEVIFVVGGRVFSADPLNNFTVREITPSIVTTVAAPFVAPAVGASVAVTVTDGAGIQPGYPIQINGERYQLDDVSGNVLTVTNVAATPGAVAAGVAVIALSVNSPINGRAWLEQAEIFLIIQDGQGRAIIYDGSNAFRSDPTRFQVPTGTVMAYGKGRLWVAVNQNEFVASDIVRGSSGTPAYDLVDAILYFTENIYLAGGHAFAVPMQAGEITAMEFMPILDTSTGNGPLIVFTDTGAFSVDAPAERALWQDVRNPIQTTVLIGSGATASYSTVSTTNSDIFFRAKDGIRSFILAIREFTNSWGNTPVSTEMDRVLKHDDELLLRYSSAIQFDNRLWMTVVPVPLPGQENGAYHQGLLSLDFHPISNMRIKTPPAYDGTHSGIRPTLLFKGMIAGKERAFCWAWNDDDHNELWEISKDNPFDNVDGRIVSFFESRAMVSRGMLELKHLEGVELFVDDVKGRVDFTLYYKPDQYPCWLLWGRQQTVCTNWRDCGTSDVLCTEPITYRPGYKTRLNFGQPQDLEDLVDDKPAWVGYQFEFRLQWEGHCRIRAMIPRMLETEELPFTTVN